MSINQTKIFIPTCQKCSGILNITINPLNFSIEYSCPNNNLHNDKKIYFKTFERFYLKEKELKHCSDCLINLENSEFFECEICKKIFCCRCHIKDIQENGHKYKVNNYTNKRCRIHYNDLTEYCFNCNKNICISCSTSDEHTNHKTIYYRNCMPSDNDIENLKIKIKEKSQFYEKLIEKIDEWSQKFSLKIGELKQNLKDEISLLEKIIFNYNKNFRNYLYIENLNYINNTINNTTNNQYLLEFYNSLSFENQTEILMRIFKCMGKKSCIKLNKIVNIKGILNNTYYKFTEKINENYFIGYCDNNQTLSFLYFDDISDIINPIYNFKIVNNFNKLSKAVSISKSTLENKIFICLSNQKQVEIIDYDLNKYIINFSYIIDNKNFNNNNNNNPNNYYKCIQLSSCLYATSDNNITIWAIQGNTYTKIKIINVNCAIYDMLLIDKDNFMFTSSSNQNLIIYNIKSSLILKKIRIDCINENNTLLKANNNFILINCYNGIGIFDIKCFEIVQYTQEYYFQLKPIITLCSCNKIYISLIQINKRNRNNNIIIKIFVTEINNGELMLIEEYDNIFTTDIINSNLCFNNGILFFDNNIFKVSKNVSEFKD